MDKKTDYYPLSPYYIGKKVKDDEENVGFKTEAPYSLVEIYDTSRELFEKTGLSRGDIVAIHSVDKGIPIKGSEELFIFKETMIIFEQQSDE